MTRCSYQPIRPARWLLIALAIGAMAGLAAAQPAAPAEPPPAEPPPAEPPPAEPPPAEPPPAEPPPSAEPPSESAEPLSPPTTPAPPPPADALSEAPAAGAAVELDPIIEPVRERRVQIHGFVSEGAFISTANDYIGKSSRGSLELFEVGVNITTQVTDRLRAGIQLFARDVGVFHDPSPRVDWAFLEYRYRRELALRAGVIKMPFGLYNEYTDIDAARLPILLPQSIYPVRNRDALLAHRGFAVAGNVPLGRAGELDYQAWFGALIIPENALTLINASLDRVDTKYVTGGQVFWSPPVEGLRIGGSYLRASIDFHATFDPAVTMAAIMAGIVPPEFDGRIVISQRPTWFAVGSVEYIRGKWLFAAEYSWTHTRQRTSLPGVIPTFEDDSERFYGMAAYQLGRRLQLGSYYSVLHLDPSDRRGHDPTWPERWYAWQRDLAATLRYDVNPYWLWKLEAHFMDGVGALDLAANPSPERYWGLFLLRTTVTF